MLSGRVTQTVLRLLDRITPNGLRLKAVPARNFRTARHHGEIDLIGWDKDVLCFIEVKTRTTRDVKPAAAAVDRKKRHDLRVVIRDYLRLLPERIFPDPPQWRFDVVTVYYEGDLRHPTFELFQNALLSS
jgi:putative endonuclease